MKESSAVGGKRGRSAVGEEDEIGTTQKREREREKVRRGRRERSRGIFASFFIFIFIFLKIYYLFWKTVYGLNWN